MSSKQLLGLVLNKGGETSHTVILARTLGIPGHPGHGQRHRLDRQRRHPGPGQRQRRGHRPADPGGRSTEITIKIEKYQIYKEQLKTLSQLPELTRDHHQFHLYANIELPFESEIVQSYGAKGIGLFRTEFLYLDSKMSISGGRAVPDLQKHRPEHLSPPAGHPHLRPGPRQVRCRRGRAARKTRRWA